MTDTRPLSAREAARRIAERRLTAVELATAYLDRIEAREGVVGAWQYLDREQALAEARRRDAAPPRGPLHGVPIAVKDLIDTVDMPTGYGSPIYRGHRPAADAACVALARAAGAVVLGKTVTTEFAAFTPGKTANPRNPAHTPGGSSSGSAAAVADGMAPLAFGSQTAGSVIRPAAYCGVVGLQAELWPDQPGGGQAARRQPRHGRHPRRKCRGRGLLCRRADRAAGAAPPCDARTAPVFRPLPHADVGRGRARHRGCPRHRASGTGTRRGSGRRIGDRPRASRARQGAGRGHGLRDVPLTGL